MASATATNRRTCPSGPFFLTQVTSVVSELTIEGASCVVDGLSVMMCDFHRQRGTLKRHGALNSSTSTLNPTRHQSIVANRLRRCSESVVTLRYG